MGSINAFGWLGQTMLGNAVSADDIRGLGAACSPRSSRLWNVFHTFYDDGAVEYLE
jgi:hypothetical protein